MLIDKLKFRKALAEVVTEMLATTTFTPTEISARLGVDASTVHHWASGRKLPDLRGLMALSCLLSLRTGETIERISKKIHKST